MNEQALIKAMYRSPDSDQPRLDFADWLTEDGQVPRADFIRADIEFQAVDVDDPRWSELVKLTRESLDAPAPIGGKS